MKHIHGEGAHTGTKSRCNYLGYKVAARTGRSGGV